MADIKPQLSVIVPVYNSERTLTRTLESLATQTLDGIEVICIDDGSTDGSLKVLRGFTANHPSFRCISTENRGAYLARERGIQNARGTYIGFCDAGDTVEPEGYQRLLSAAKREDADIAIGAFQRFADGAASAPEMASFGNASHVISDKSGWTASINTALWNKVFRSELLAHRTVLEQPPRVMEDALFFLDLLPHASRIAFIDDLVYRYQVDEGSAMSSIEAAEVPALIEAWVQVRNQIAQRNPGFAGIIDVAAFIHLGISAPLRLCKEPHADQHQSSQRIRHALSTRFPTYRKSPYLTSRYTRCWPSMRKAHLAALCDRMHLLPAAIWAYRLFSRMRGSSPSWN